jgi:hypothetical protein
MTSQQIASIGRQLLAVLGIVFGILTASVGALHLPVVVSAWMGVAGAVILAIEHYVSDPSTGTTNAPTPVVATPVAGPAMPTSAH